MAITYPCTFEEVAEKPLEQELSPLESNSFQKIRTRNEAIHGKVNEVKGNLAGRLSHYVVKEIKKASAKVLNECPRNEIRAASAICALSIPYTAKVHYVRQDEKKFYLATEYCCHGELGSAIQKSGFPSEDGAMEVALEILTALNGLHGHGIAHRDISFENVLVAEDGSCRLIDFAQAIMVSPAGKIDCEASVPIMSVATDLPGKGPLRGPELFSGDSYLASKVDMFAVGVMLYVMVAGMYPFEAKGLHSTDRRIAEFNEFFPAGEANAARCIRVRQQLEKVSARRARQLSANCIDLIEKLLAPNPACRPSAEQALAHPWFAVADRTEPVIQDVVEYASTRDLSDFDQMTDCSECSNSDVYPGFSPRAVPYP